MTEPKKSVQEILREPFRPEQIGKLPRVTCRACTDASNWPKHCNAHQVISCSTCKQRITEAHIHLDYVGHAAATDRLLTADPAWNWRPAHRDVDPALLAKAIETGNPEIVRLVLDNAPPKLDANGGLWIEMTVGGVTRLGYGDATGKRGANAVKELIGDAIRNAGMRFGVALDLWSKEDLAEKPDDGPAQLTQAPPETTRSRPSGRRGRADTSNTPPPDETADAGGESPAQQLADLAQQITDLGELRGVWQTAKEKNLGNTEVVDKASGELGSLFALITARKNTLEAAAPPTVPPAPAEAVPPADGEADAQAQALVAFYSAAKRAGLNKSQADGRFMSATHKSVSEATAQELLEFAHGTSEVA